MKKMAKYLTIFLVIMLTSNLMGMWISITHSVEVPIRPVVTRGSVGLNKAAIAEHKKISPLIDAPLKQLVTMYDSYKSKGCVQSEKKGCAKRLQQIIRKYGDFMTTLSEKLPALQEKLEKAANSYRSNLKKYRRETTLEKMWQEMQNRSNVSPRKRISQKIYRKKGVAGRLKMLLGLVRSFKAGSPSSGIMGTAKHYASLRDSVETIQQLNREVIQQHLELEIVSLTDAEFNKNYDKNVEKFKGLLGIIFGPEELSEEDLAGSLPVPAKRPKDPTVNKWLKQRF